jgi:hypothetical protein
MIKIEKNVPVPPKEGRPNKYPFESMDVGDSFELKGVPKTTALNSANSWASRHNKKAKFIIRYDKETKILRLWRTK